MGRDGAVLLYGPSTWTQQPHTYGCVTYRRTIVASKYTTKARAQRDKRDSVMHDYLVERIGEKRKRQEK